MVPSVYVTDQGGVPVKAMLNVLLLPAQTVPPPLRVAVGLALIVTCFSAELVHPPCLIVSLAV